MVSPRVIGGFEETGSGAQPARATLVGACGVVPTAFGAVALSGRERGRGWRRWFWTGPGRAMIPIGEFVWQVVAEGYDVV
jgi:hypothetical protein